MGSRSGPPPLRRCLRRHRSDRPFGIRFAPRRTARVRRSSPQVRPGRSRTTFGCHPEPTGFAGFSKRLSASDARLPRSTGRNRPPRRIRPSRWLCLPIAPEKARIVHRRRRDRRTDADRSADAIRCAAACRCPGSATEPTTLPGLPGRSKKNHRYRRTVRRADGDATWLKIPRPNACVLR